MERKGHTLTPDDREWLLERAAIYEYEAGMSREEADRRAMQDLEERENEYG